MKELMNVQPITTDDIKKYATNGVFVHRNPWDTMNIPKNVRKGKSVEELQSLRRKMFYGKRLIARYGLEECRRLKIVDEQGLFDEQAYNELVKGVAQQKQKESEEHA